MHFVNNRLLPKVVAFGKMVGDVKPVVLVGGLG